MMFNVDRNKPLCKELLQTEEQVRYGQQAIVEKWIQNAITRMWITLKWLIFFWRLIDSKHWSGQIVNNAIGRKCRTQGRY